MQEDDRDDEIALLRNLAKEWCKVFESFEGHILWHEIPDRTASKLTAVTKRHVGLVLDKEYNSEDS